MTDSEPDAGPGAVPDDLPSVPWLAHLKRIAALAATGVHYAREDGVGRPGEGAFDLDRYGEIAALSGELLAALAGSTPTRIAGLIADADRGYATPLVDVRGALVEDDRVLLVRERSDGRWTLPGGFADVGMTAATNVEREVREEAGLEVRAERLYAVVHKAAHDYAPDVRDFYKLFFLCRRVGSRADAPRACGVETLDAGFFPRRALPELSTGRVIASHLDLAFDFHADPHRSVVFD